MDEEKTVVMCQRASPDGPNTDSILSSCNQCGYPIWIAKSTPIIEGARYLCMECVPWDEIDDIAAPTVDQWIDVLKHRAKL